MKGVMAKDKQRRLLPSLREKKRYLAFEVISKSSIPQQAASETIQQSVLSFGGELGAATAGLYVLPKLFQKQKGILKTSHTTLDLVRASLCDIKQIGSEPVIVRSIGVSGSLKKVKNLGG